MYFFYHFYKFSSHINNRYIMFSLSKTHARSLLRLHINLPLTSSIVRKLLNVSMNVVRSNEEQKVSTQKGIITNSDFTLITTLFNKNRELRNIIQILYLFNLSLGKSNFNFWKGKFSFRKANLNFRKCIYYFRKGSFNYWKVNSISEQWLLVCLMFSL